MYPKCARPADRLLRAGRTCKASLALKLLGRARNATGDQVTGFELVPRIGLDPGLRVGAGCGRSFVPRPYEWYALIELSSSRSGCRAAGNLLETMLGEAIEAGDVLDAVVASSLEQRKALVENPRRHPRGTEEGRPASSIKHDVSVPVAQVPFLHRPSLHAGRRGRDGRRAGRAFRASRRWQYPFQPERGPRAPTSRRSSIAGKR